MAKSQVKMLCNLGWMDAVKYALPGEGKGEELPAEGQVISVTEDQARVMVSVLKCAEPVEDERHQPKQRVRQEETATK